MSASRTWLPRLLSRPIPELREQVGRILAMQRHIVLPARTMVTAVVLYYLFYARWLAEAETQRKLAFETLQGYFIAYLIVSAGAAILLTIQRFPGRLVPWVVFVMGLFDGVLLAGLTMETGGFGSDLYWVFPGLIVLNALSIPLATPQIVLNLFLSLFFLAAGLADVRMRENEPPLLPQPGVRIGPRRAADDTRTEPIPRASRTNPPPRESVDSPRLARTNSTPKSRANTLPQEPAETPEPFLLRLIILWLLTASCYGVQLLSFRDRQAAQEAREAAARNSELQTAGRLAAEIAHQLKNPLGIINNAAFSLQRGLREGRTDLGEQLQIIREEVERSDRIITQLLGYAQLSEGRVEKLDVAAEIERAIQEVLPPAAHYAITVERRVEESLPALMMQRVHLGAVLVNLLQNAREAAQAPGRIEISARAEGDNAVEISIADNGPGIAPEYLNRVFEAYFSRKEKGTGLGLAIVKHNVELYGGTVRAESALGNGARFVLMFPARIFVK